jgi:hypothetical protein
MDFTGNKLDRLKQSTINQKSALPSVHEMSRESSKRLVNFSRPISPQNSPQTKQPAKDRPMQGGGWFAGAVVHENNMRHHVESIRDVVPEYATASQAPPLLETDRHSHKFKKLLASTTGSTKVKGPGWKPTVIRANSLETSKWSSINDHPTTAQSTGQVQPAQDFSLDHRLSSIIHQSSNETPEEAHKSSTSVIEHDIGASFSRRYSLSPPRALQFDVASNELMHHPLGRSASPVKSALKFSQPRFNRTKSPPVQPEQGRKKSVRINLELIPGEESTGLSGSKYAPPTPVKVKSTFEDDMSGLMQPRPALPFFDSIRSQHRDHNQEIPLEHARTTKSFATAHHSLPDRAESPTDGAPIQSLLAGKGTRREESDTPKTVDHFGDRPALSETSTMNPNHENAGLPTFTTTPKSSYSDSNTTKVLVSISTPLEQSSIKNFEPPIPISQDQEFFSIPGSFPDAHYGDMHNFQPKPEIVAIPTISTVVNPPAVESDGSLESSDDDSVYEDAAEELENYEFASLDQILEEPSPGSIEMRNSYVTDNTKKTLLRQESGDTLALERRLEEARLNSTAQVQKQAPSPSPETLSKQHSVNDDKTACSPAPPGQQHSSTEIQSPLTTSKWSPINTPRQRHQITTVDPYKWVSQASPTPNPSNSIGATISIQTSPPQKPALVRKGSSDSISSFIRSRPSSSRLDGRYSLRQSMRASSIDGLEVTRRGRPEHLPVSPVDNSLQYSLRSSMRNSISPTSAPKKESAWKRLTSPPRINNILRSSKRKQGNSKFGRRLSGSVADSNDDLHRRNFVSRFADSDDEDFNSPQHETPIKLTSIRGIPRKHDEAEGDSTDLDDSDDERVHVPPPVPTLTYDQRADTVSQPSDGAIPKATATQNQGLASSKFAPTRPSSHRRWHSFLVVGNRKQKFTQQSNISTPTLTNAPEKDLHAYGKGKLRRKNQQASQSTGANMPWPLSDHASPGFGSNLASPIGVAKAKGAGFDFTNHSDESPVAPRGSLRKDTVGLEAHIRPQTNGTSSHVVTADISANQKANKDEKGPLGKFKRMMKFSKKQRETESI